MTYTILMPEDIIANFILAIQQYPNIALLIVFLVAFSESLIIIGLIVPGAILMVLFGALIAIDALAFWPTVFFAVSGAVAGDSLSYWLGLRYQQNFTASGLYHDIQMSLFVRINFSINMA